MKINYSLVASIVTLTLYRGEKFSDDTKEIISEHVFDAGECPAALKDGTIEKSLAGYGLLKLLQDRTSQEKDPEAKVALMGEYFDNFFTEGLWKKPAAERAPSAGGSRRKIGASLAEAVARLQGITAIQAEGALKALDKETFDNLVKNEKVVAMVTEVESEAGEAVDLDGLL